MHTGPNTLQITADSPRFAHINIHCVAVKMCPLPVELGHFLLPALLKGWRQFVTFVFWVQRPEIFTGQWPPIAFQQHAKTQHRSIPLEI